MAKKILSVLTGHAIFELKKCLYTVQESSGWEELLCCRIRDMVPEYADRRVMV